MKETKKSKKKGKKGGHKFPGSEAPVASSVNHEPRYDLDTLTRAEEIKRDGKRHSLALAEGKRQADRLGKVIGAGGVRHRPSDEAEMDRYAQQRARPKRGAVKEA